jgi:transcriptional regulator with XRE-family HTH domain
MDPVRTPTGLQALAAYVADAARAAGYDIDSPRGGGKTALARDAGVSLSTVSRLLSAERAPKPETYEGFAKALRVPLREFLVRGGIISSGSLPGRPETAVRSRPITPREAAAELGITDPSDLTLFLAMVDRLRQPHGQTADPFGGDAAAEA